MFVSCDPGEIRDFFKLGIMKEAQKKSLLRTILDDHRDAAIYKEAIKILALMLEDDNVAAPEFEDPLLAHIVKRITDLRLGNKVLKTKQLRCYEEKQK